MNQAVSNHYFTALQRLARAYPPLSARGVIRLQNEDFQVKEVLGFDLSDEGQHLWCRVRKSGLNTTDVVRRLSDSFKIPRRDIGFSGLKDKYALTEQWISVPREKITENIQLEAFNIEKDGFEVVETSFHSKKLKRGVHCANEFHLTIRSVQAEKLAIEARLNQMKDQGVPNYFGEQRFGRKANNLVSAERYFSGDFKRPDRQLKSMLLSAARSWLFNQVLSVRVIDGTWNKALQGEAIQFDGSQSFFTYDGTDSSVIDRIHTQTCHPTGPLWGQGLPPCAEAPLSLEKRCIQQYEVFARGLVKAGLKQQRRALRVNLSTLSWQWNELDTLFLQFTLPRGAFATSVLRELIEY